MPFMVNGKQENLLNTYLEIWHEKQKKFCNFFLQLLFFLIEEMSIDLSYGYCFF